jgi:hypothetical protein
VERRKGKRKNVGNGGEERERGEKREINKLRMS